MTALGSCEGEVAEPTPAAPSGARSDSGAAAPRAAALVFARSSAVIAQRFTFVGRAMAVLSADCASRALTMVATAWKLTFPTAASSAVNV